jgi:hypothetical protein
MGKINLENNKKNHIFVVQKCKKVIFRYIGYRDKTLNIKLNY